MNIRYFIGAAESAVYQMRISRVMINLRFHRKWFKRPEMILPEKRPFLELGFV